MDIAVNLDKNEAKIIELNPFGRPDGRGTGTCLFDRNSPSDLAILFGSVEVIQCSLQNRASRESAM